MRAVVIYENGDLNCLRVEKLSEPEPQRNEVIVELRAAALNHLDIWVRRGLRGQKLTLPHILGSDGSGVVIAKGRDVENIRIGDAVIINPALSCGSCEYCQKGEQSLCVSFGIIGMSRAGTYAEKIAVPAQNVYPKPAHLNFQQAAALPLAYQTAWRMLINRGKLKAGEVLLIHGIGGGVAIACLQIARLTGATVIVTSSSDTKIEKAKKMGAEYGVNYRTDNVAKAVMEFTNGRGVDIIADTVGAATLPLNFEVIRKGGRIVLCGVTSGHSCQINIQTLYWNQINISGSTMGSAEDFRQMLAAVESAKIIPVIDSIEPLDNIRTATERMERAIHFGKIVLDIHR